MEIAKWGRKCLRLHNSVGLCFPIAANITVMTNRQIQKNVLLDLYTFLYLPKLHYACFAYLLSCFYSSIYAFKQ